eukprot:CAMPEP_0184438290 /NCGR_PEP_ID=MMETSP0738-20130409/644250_1 /TAXON_ID=385413 /ORGANISM="Thalassiosira miniscula, Strain CCMP1093" /LENGTH=48 /DNA_ID= /DNA_START= /DNA_END= /DNA_ORIENTATION=
MAGAARGKDNTTAAMKRREGMGRSPVDTKFALKDTSIVLIGIAPCQFK